MAIIPYYTDNGSVYIVGTGVTQKEFKAVVTEFTSTPGTRDIEVVNTFSSSFVNENRPDITEIAITCVASGGDLPLYWFGGSGADAYPRHYVGNSTIVNPDVKYLQFDKSSAAQKLWVFSGAYMTDIEETNNTDDATTWSITFKTTADNTHFWWTPNAAASGLPSL